MKISACVIVKNEERNLEFCLRSLHRQVDEIIVADTGSTDRTVQVAERYGASVYTYPWRDDFAAARNFALSKATGEWIVFPDADEHFSALAAGRLRRLVETYGTRCDAFLLRMNNIDPEAGNRQIDYFYQIRIFRNHPVIRYEGAIHEVLKRTDGKHLDVGKLSPKDLEMLHTGYAKSKVKEKGRRNLALLLKQLRLYPQDPSLHAYLSDCYFILEEYQKSVQYAQLAIRYQMPETGYNSRIYRHLIQSLRFLNASQAVLEKSITEAIHQFPDLPDFYAAYALFLADCKQFEKAAAYMEMAEKASNAYDGVEPSFVSLHEVKGQLLQRLGAEEQRLLNLYIEASSSEFQTEGGR